jgi:hypothetical protein
MNSMMDYENYLTRSENIKQEGARGGGTVG